MSKKVGIPCIIIFLVFCVMNITQKTISKDITAQGISVKKYLHLSDSPYKSLTGAGVTVAILDTGISTHSDIKRERIIYFQDFVNNKVDPYDDNGHGTFVAGIIGANGKLKGIAPEVNFVDLKVLNSNGSSTYEILNNAVQWLVDNSEKYSINVVNLSLGLGKYMSEENDQLALNLELLRERGIIIVTSSGNSGPEENTVLYPGNLNSVITVGYVNNKRTLDFSDDKVAEKSGRGIIQDHKCKPDLVTLGVDIYSLDLNRTYTVNSGSSYSTAIVSGVISLLYQKYNNSTVEEVLYENTIELKDANLCSQGRGQIIFNK